LFLRFRQTRRLYAFNDQLNDAITLLANSLRSGYSLLQSMEMVGRELPPPMSEEFQRVTREIGLGLSNQDALNNLLRRIESDDLDMMITAINIHHEVGGNLAEILDTIGHTIRERVRIKGEIRTLTAMARYSGYLVSILPVAVAGLLFVMNTDYMSGLWQDPCGVQMILVAGIGMVSGWIIIRRVVNIDI
jgi:tight adherence protein B